jgi:hypothetical protein
MLERRAHPRSLTLKTGKIVGADNTREIDCAILNISESGALVLVSDPTQVPQTFLLEVDPTHRIYACERIWIDGNRIGLTCHLAAAGCRSEP